jgi:hypothetical protein
MEVSIRVFIVVTMAICLASVANAAQGTATFYTPPYVREYFYEICYNYYKNLIGI